jgi:hypothetical protein
MSHVYILWSKLIHHKLFFQITCLISFFIYLPFLDAQPFGDDIVYIFKNYSLIDAPHPLVYWNITTEYFKSWPFSFSFLWLEFKLFDHHYWAYRLVNILLHWLICFRVFKLLESYEFKHSRLVFLTLLLHPVAIENIFWIFQVKTLLSTLLAINCIILINNFYQFKHKWNYFQSILLFFFSLAAKSTAILLPFYLIFISRKHSLKFRLITVTPFLLISFFMGAESLKGVLTTKDEIKKIENYQKDYFKQTIRLEEINQTKSSLLNKSQNNVETIYIKDVEKAKYLESFVSYFGSIINLEKISNKMIIIANTTLFYLKSMLGLNINRLIYEDLNLRQLQTYINFIIFVILIIALIFYNKNYLHLLLALLFYLPISGLFYVPYMQFSYVADHWFYPALPFLLTFLFLLVNELKIINKFKQHIFTIVFSLLAVQTISYAQRLKDTKQYFYSEIKTNKSQILLEYLVELEKNDHRYEEALNLTIQLFHLAVTKHEAIIENILYLAKLTNNDLIYYKYLQLKAILYFKNSSSAMAIALLEEIPISLRNDEYHYLKGLFYAFSGRLNSNLIEQLENILKN